MFTDLINCFHEPSALWPAHLTCCSPIEPRQLFEGSQRLWESVSINQSISGGQCQSGCICCLQHSWDWSLSAAHTTASDSELIMMQPYPSDAHSHAHTDNRCHRDILLSSTASLICIKKNLRASSSSAATANYSPPRKRHLPSFTMSPVWWRIHQACRRLCLNDSPEGRLNPFAEEDVHLPAQASTASEGSRLNLF